MLGQRTYRLPDSLADDLAKLREMIAQVRAGDLAPERLRAFRVPMGVYEQRENGAFMLRVRVPAGGVLPHQLRALADAAHNRYMRDALEQFFGLSERLWHLALPQVDWLVAALDRHAALVSAIKTRDAAQAGALMRDHVLDFQRHVEEALRSQ